MEEEIDADYTGIEAALPNWMSLIVTLLSTHIVQLYDHNSLFYITMGGKDGFPSGNIISQVRE